MMEYTLKLSHIFEQQYIEHRNSGRTKVLEKINKLLLELSTSPRKGTGKPERLKDVDKIDLTLDPQEIHIWSRRITDEHRLVYRIYDEAQLIFVMLCWGHYTDLKKFYGCEFLFED